MEPYIGYLKPAMGLDVLRCKTEVGVPQELAVFCPAYSLVRVVMLKAGPAAGGAGEPRQLHRRAKVNAARPARRHTAQPGDQPAPARPR